MKTLDARMSKSNISLTEGIVDDFESFVKRSIKALNESNIEYVVIGKLAAIKYGRSRSTRDTDLIIRIAPSRKKIDMISV